MCRKSNATCSHNLAILRQLVTVLRIIPESRYVHYQQNHPKEYNVRQFRQCYVMFVCPPGGLATAGTGSKSNIWQAIRIWLAPASPSVPPGRNALSPGRNALSPGTAELRTRFAELSPLGGCPLGGSSSQLTFCRLRPWERRGTPFVRSTYTATGPAAMPRAVLCSGLEVLPTSADCNARLLH